MSTRIVDIKVFADEVEAELKGVVSKFWVSYDPGEIVDPDRLTELANKAAEIKGMETVSDGSHTFGELYEHRAALFGALMVSNRSNSWFADKHEDGDMFPGYFIAGMDTDEGPVTYHYAIKDWYDRFKKAGITHLETSPPWDGHTPNDVINRLIKSFYGE